jgi:hypothetical protein
MAANPLSHSKSTAAENTAGVGPLTVEDKLQQFWQKNRMIVLGLCVVVLVAIIGKGLWDRQQASNEREIESAYAAANTPEQLRAFAAAHPGHTLGAIAELRVADEAYNVGKASDALAGYEKACAILKDGPLATRAQLGRALAKVQSGKTAEGTEELKKLAEDPKVLNTARAQAAYQLAALAADAGNSADVEKYINLVNQIDPASSWARRATMLRASLPTPAAVSVAPAMGTPTTTKPSEGEKKDASSPSVQLNLPKK